MNYKFLLLAIVASASLGACGGGGGGSDSGSSVSPSPVSTAPSPNPAPAPTPAPVLEVSIVSADGRDNPETILIDDGTSVELTLQIKNTTGEALVYESSTRSDSQAINVRFDDNSVVLETNEISFDIDELVQTLTLKVKAGDLTAETNLVVAVMNNERARYSDAAAMLTALENFSKFPLDQIRSVERRYSLQSEILGYISRSELDRRTQYQIDKANSAWESLVSLINDNSDIAYRSEPLDDEDAVKQTGEMQSLITEAFEIYKHYYDDSFLANEYSNLDLGLPQFYPISNVSDLSIDKDSGELSAIKIDGRYGQWLKGNNGSSEFEFNEEYRFLETASSAAYCGIL
ncbi:hypothetical protein PN836_005465 [Ningiella sp. W23]|uniref:hypothetical protein n=1 Tax=Ningiella sp. W23 TaxID=3023715 RepID=UPI0037577E54